MGTAHECVAKLQELRDAGVDEFMLYGSTPAENASLIRAWRDHTEEEEKDRVAAG
jgi:hypothetical protein